MTTDRLRHNAFRFIAGVTAVLSLSVGAAAVTAVTTAGNTATAETTVVLADGFGWDCVQRPC